jgi:integrase
LVVRVLVCGTQARKARSPHIYLALNMALNAGMRDKEIKTLTWAQIHFDKNFLAVGRSKTEGGDGRTIPLNSALLPGAARIRGMVQRKNSKEVRPGWYVFPWESRAPPTQRAMSRCSKLPGPMSAGMRR